MRALSSRFGIDGSSVMPALRLYDGFRSLHCRIAVNPVVAIRPVFCLTLVAFLTMGAWSQAAPKKRVAVFDFDSGAVQSGIEPRRATIRPSQPGHSQTTVNPGSFPLTPPDLGRLVSELLISKLAENGNVTVVERNAIDKILAEQNLENSNRADPVTAAKLGAVLGADGIILGTITHYEYDDGIHGQGTSSRIVVRGGSYSPKVKHDIRARIAISTRLVLPDTGEILAASEGNGETRRDAVLGVAGGANIPVLNETMDKAVAQVAAQLEPELLRLPSRVPLIEGLVADAGEGGRLVVNVGARNGLKVGDHLQILRSGKEILDPATGKVLLREDTLLGEAVVTAVNDVSAVARYNGSEPVKVRDLVKSISNRH